VKLESLHRDESEIFESLNKPNMLKQINTSNKRLERQRYLLFEVLSEEKLAITEKEFIEYFWEIFTKIFGEIGSSRAGVYLNKFNEEKAFGILRCSNYSLDNVRTTFTMMSEIKKISILIHVMKISGTLKNLLQIEKKKSGNKN
jgi:RNase P/RNase MRP subunit POP5